MSTKIKLTCRVFFTKKIIPVLSMLNSGSFSLNKRIKKESEISSLVPRDIYNKNINYQPPKVLRYVILQKIVNHGEKGSKRFPTPSQQI